MGDSVSSWTGYDEVAEAYDRHLAANGYAALARDLVLLLNVAPGGSLLDVGCGTGALMLPAQEAVGSGGQAVGVDVSLAMLHRASSHGVRPLVAAGLPDLPFRDRSFDGVAASLVLSHVASWEEALRDMVRVLRPGGWLGVTAGARKASAPNPAYQAWVEAVESLVGREVLREVAARVLPWEAWLSDAGNVAVALATVGLERVEVEQREYRVVMALDEYLSMLDVFLYGRLVRQRSGPVRWKASRKQVEDLARARCGERVEYVSRYHLGVARRPAAGAPPPLTPLEKKPT